MLVLVEIGPFPISVSHNKDDSTESEEACMSIVITQKRERSTLVHTKTSEDSIRKLSICCKFGLYLVV